MGNQHQCQSHVLDGWLTHTSHELKQEDWHGILGETQTMKYNEAGQPILTNRNRILQGGDEDYRVVGGAFGTEFAARTNDQRRKMPEETKHLFKLDDEVVYHSLWDNEEPSESKTNPNNLRASSSTATIPSSSSSSSSLWKRILG